MARAPPLPIFIMKGSMAAVNSIDQLPPNLLCAGTIEGKVHLWDLETKRETYNFQAGQESCLSVYYTDSQLVTQEKGGVIHIWSPQGGDFTKKASIKCSYVGFCKIELNSFSSSTDILIYAPGEDSTINILSLKSQKIVSSLNPISEKLGEIMVMKHFEMNGSAYLLSGYESGHIYLWDLNRNKYLSELKLDETPMDLDFDPQKLMGVCGTESNAFSLFKLSMETCLLSLHKKIEITNPGVSRTRLRPDGKLLALGCWDGRIRLYSWKTLKPLAVLSEHQETIHDVYFSSGQPLMAVAGKDQRISLWDVYNQ